MVGTDPQKPIHLMLWTQNPKQIWDFTPWDTETLKECKHQILEQETLNQLKAYHYMAHLHKDIIENLMPRDATLRRVQRPHILEKIPQERHLILWQNHSNSLRYHTCRDTDPQTAWVLSSQTETQTAEWPHILDIGTKSAQRPEKYLWRIIRNENLKMPEPPHSGTQTHRILSPHHQGESHKGWESPHPG